ACYMRFINSIWLRAAHTSSFMFAQAAWAPARALCDHDGMRPRIHAIAIPSEVGDFADEVRRVYLELGRVFGAESLAGECSPAVDVYETDDTLNNTVDLPGVDPTTVRIVCKGDSVLIAGEKAPRRARSVPTFPLVERGHGR